MLSFNHYLVLQERHSEHALFFNGVRFINSFINNHCTSDSNILNRWWNYKIIWNLYVTIDVFQ